jgi:hypothetical protein
MIEKDILEWVAQRHGGSAMRKQIEHAEVASREFTGVGLYTNLTLDDRTSLPPIQPLEIPFSGPVIESPALELGASALVWCDDSGYLKTIEIAAFGDHYPETELEYTLKEFDHT